MLPNAYRVLLAVSISTLICTMLVFVCCAPGRIERKAEYSIELVPYLGGFGIDMFKKNEKVFPVTVKATSSQDVTRKYEVVLNDSIVGARAEVEMEDGFVLFVEFIKVKDEIRIKTQPKKPVEVGQTKSARMHSVYNKMVWCSTRIFMDLSGKKLVMGIVFDDAENYRIGFIPVDF